MRLLQHWGKEPLVHFLLIGSALFLLYGWQGYSAPTPVGPSGVSATQITVTSDDIERMNTLFARTWQRPATEEERKDLVDDFVRNEIYYREALLIGLDRDDAVLKRRLRQKMEFIYENISDLAEPVDEDLIDFMQAHPEKYFTDPRIGFRQVYISIDKRGTSAASDAGKILVQLNAGADPDTVGDFTLLEAEVPLSPLPEISRQFGNDFAQSLPESRPGVWVGPIRSGYGLHLVRVAGRVSGRLPDLKEVRELVKRDWMVEKQKALKDAAYAKIQKRYSVIVERPAVGAAPLVNAAQAKERAR